MSSCSTASPSGSRRVAPRSSKTCQSRMRRKWARWAYSWCRARPEGGALLAGTETHVRVTGLRVPGICVLEDRDEIRVCNTGGSLYFSAERLAVVEPYGGPDKALCPRCQEPLHSGTMVVRCPNCGIRHHEYANAEENRKCWTYDVGCAQCGRNTRLDTNYEWQPEEVCR